MRMCVVLCAPACLRVLLAVAGCGRGDRRVCKYALLLHPWQMDSYQLVSRPHFVCTPRGKGQRERHRKGERAGEIDKDRREREREREEIRGVRERLKDAGG
jgi:hypothetical protein